MKSNSFCSLVHINNVLLQICPTETTLAFLQIMRHINRKTINPKLNKIWPMFENMNNKFME
jgi:hypothetical protein